MNHSAHKHTDSLWAVTLVRWYREILMKILFFISDCDSLVTATL